MPTSMRHLGLVFVAVVALTATAPRQAEAETVAELINAIRLGELLDIMSEEGEAYGDTIAEDLFLGDGGAEWGEVVSRIYDPEWMKTEFYDAFAEALDGDDVGAMVSFFEAEPGREIISLELAARRALMDEAIEESSKAAAAQMLSEETERANQLRRFVDANDLVETNVTGALNANLAFMTGLLDGGALPDGLTESELLNTVWAQEPEIRISTLEWVFGYAGLAYAPLSDDDMETYIAFSESPAGEQMNDALFEAFDVVFNQISRNLGLGASRFMGQQEL